MADNIKDFTITWISAAVIIFALLSFTFIFVYSNNSAALGENEDQLNILSGNFSDHLTEIEENMDTQMNASAKLNSEEATLGSTSSSSSSYSLMGETQTSWTNIKIMIAWVFAGSFGMTVIKILSGIVGLVGLYYVIKFIKSLF